MGIKEKCVLKLLAFKKLGQTFRTLFTCHDQAGVGKELRYLLSGGGSDRDEDFVIEVESVVFGIFQKKLGAGSARDQNMAPEWGRSGSLC